jgi:histidinol-phosphate aminotransferase
MTPEQLIRPEIQRLSAYHVADATGMVKLDAMENPYLLPDDLRAELGEKLRDSAINRYPDPHATAVQQALRQAFAIDPAYDIMLGNGSDELIQIIASALAKPGAALLAVEPSFVMYRMIAVFAGLRYIGVPLQLDFTLDEAAVLDAIEREQPELVFLAYPNNPTGNVFDRAVIERILAAAPGLVVIDEAYHAFAGGMSFLGELARFENLLLMRTVSKLGLAGLRLGYMIGRPVWIKEFDKVRLPYNVNILTQVAARFALEHVDVLERQAAFLVDERARLMQALCALNEVQAFESSANFILFRLPNALQVFAGLKRRGILIKNLHGTHPLLDNCLRVTVGAPLENDAFLIALSAELKLEN